jgi:two-component system response regulator MprA
VYIQCKFEKKGIRYVENFFVVDDDQKLLKMLTRTLIYENLDVITAANGEEALKQIEVHKPDLLNRRTG